MGLDDLAKAYYEAVAASKWGPDWRQKRALVEAQTGHTQAETRGTDAQTDYTRAEAAHTAAQTSQVGVDTATKQFTLDKLRTDEKEMADALTKAGYSSESALKIAKEQTAQKLSQAQANEATARGHQADAEASYYRRKPSSESMGTQVMVPDPNDPNPDLKKRNKVLAYLSPEGIRYAPPGSVDLASGRGQNQRDQQNSESDAGLDTLLQNADFSLKQYEQQFKDSQGNDLGALGSIGHAIAHPMQRGLALNQYHTALAPVTFAFGRQVIGEKGRVPVQIQAMNENAHGLNSTALALSDPSELRRRFNVMISALNASRRARGAAPVPVAIYGNTNGLEGGGGPAAPAPAAGGGPRPAAGGTHLYFNASGDACPGNQPCR